MAMSCILPEGLPATWAERSADLMAHPPWTQPFWLDTIGRVKAENWFLIFMAELYWDLERVLMQQGFDDRYDKSL